MNLVEISDYLGFFKWKITFNFKSNLLFHLTVKAIPGFLFFVFCFFQKKKGKIITTFLDDNLEISIK